MEYSKQSFFLINNLELSFFPNKGFVIIIRNGLNLITYVLINHLIFFLGVGRFIFIKLFLKFNVVTVQIYDNHFFLDIRFFYMVLFSYLVKFRFWRYSSARHDVFSYRIYFSYYLVYV